MNTLVRLALPVLLASVLQPLSVQAGDAAAGEQKAATCIACHGVDGKASQPGYPNLAGQYESYLAHSLRSYRSGARENAIMYGFASQLSDADIADLAAWFASLDGTLQTAPRP